MKITKQEFDKLYDNNISKKEYDSIIDKIDDRVSDIVHIMVPNATKGNNWYAYGNVDYYDENSGGEFDPTEYKKYIEIGRSCSLPGPYDDEYDNYFPTRWLWEDFEEEFKKETSQYNSNQEKEKDRKKKQREELKLKKEQFKSIIQSKLTKEELKYIKFK